MWLDRSGSVRFPSCMITHMGMIALLALLLGGSSLHAQHVLRGSVVDTTGADLAGVDVILVGAGRRATTDSRGRYAVIDIPAGRFEIVFRRLGYTPLVMFRSFMGDTGTTVVDVQLATEAVVLPEVETKARGPEAVPAKLRAWAERRERGEGTFFDNAFLRENEHRQLKEVLRRVIGFRRVRFTNGAGYGAATGTRTISLSRRPTPIGAPTACYMSVYLDGAMIWRSGSTSTPPDLDSFPVQQLAAIEVFTSASEMPAQFNTASTCGVLSLWTR